MTLGNFPVCLLERKVLGIVDYAVKNRIEALQALQAEPCEFDGSNLPGSEESRKFMDGSKAYFFSIDGSACVGGSAQLHRATGGHGILPHQGCRVKQERRRHAII